MATQTAQTPTYFELLQEQGELQSRLEAAVKAMDEATIIAVKERQQAMPGLLFQAQQQYLQAELARLEGEAPDIVSRVHVAEAAAQAGRTVYQQTVAKARETLEALDSAARAARGDEELNQRRQSEVREALQSSHKSERARIEALAR